VNFLSNLDQARKRFLAGHKRLYASSLAFKTVLAVVPILAVLMSLLSADVFTQKREQLLDQLVDLIYPLDAATVDPTLNPDERQNLEQLNQRGKQQIRHSVRKFAAHSGKVGLIGVLVFFFVILFLMRDVEQSFNFLWGARENRPIFSQLLKYGLLVIGAPLLAILLMNLSQWAKDNHLLSPFLHLWLFRVALPFGLLGFILSWVYRSLPNAQVQWKAALGGGFLAALLLELGRRGMAWYAMNVMGQSHAYGALWVFPVILLWFYVSWVIILFGAEMTYVAQNYGRK